MVTGMITITVVMGTVMRMVAIIITSRKISIQLLQSARS